MSRQTDQFAGCFPRSENVTGGLGIIELVLLLALFVLVVLGFGLLL